MAWETDGWAGGEQAAQGAGWSPTVREVDAWNLFLEHLKGAERSELYKLVQTEIS